jgi:hypothetical protein
LDFSLTMASFWPYDRNWNAQESESNTSQSPTKLNPRWKEILEKRNSFDENTNNEKNTVGNSPIPPRRVVKSSNEPQEGEEAAPVNLYEESKAYENTK